MIKPNTNFLKQRDEINQVNLMNVSDTERVNTITFEATCKKCIRIGGCHYEKIPCDYKKKIKRLIQVMDKKQQMAYLRRIEKMKFQEIEEELSNIINIMETEN